MSGRSHPAAVISDVSLHDRPGAMRVGVCALGVALLAGCSLVPVYQPPGIPLVQTFDGAASGGAALADTVPVRSGWWREYHDPALDALVEHSLQNNFTLAAAIASVEQARGNAEKAGAAQYPSLSVGGTFDRSHQGRGSTGAGSLALKTTDRRVFQWRSDCSGGRNLAVCSYIIGVCVGSSARRRTDTIRARAAQTVVC